MLVIIVLSKLTCAQASWGLLIIKTIIIIIKKNPKQNCLDGKISSIKPINLF